VIDLKTGCRCYTQREWFSRCGRPYEYGHVSLERIDGTFQVTAPDHAVAMSKQDVEALIGQAL